MNQSRVPFRSADIQRIALCQIDDIVAVDIVIGSKAILSEADLHVVQCVADDDQFSWVLIGECDSSTIRALVPIFLKCGVDHINEIETHVASDPDSIWIDILNHGCDPIALKEVGSCSIPWREPLIGGEIVTKYADAVISDVCDVTNHDGLGIVRFNAGRPSFDDCIIGDIDDACALIMANPEPAGFNEFDGVYELSGESIGVVVPALLESKT